MSHIHLGGSTYFQYLGILCPKEGPNPSEVPSFRNCRLSLHLLFPSKSRDPLRKNYRNDSDHPQHILIVAKKYEVTHLGVLGGYMGLEVGNMSEVLILNNVFG